MDAAQFDARLLVGSVRTDDTFFPEYVKSTLFIEGAFLVSVGVDAVLVGTVVLNAVRIVDDNGFIDESLVIATDLWFFSGSILDELEDEAVVELRVVEPACWVAEVDADLYIVIES